MKKYVVYCSERIFEVDNSYLDNIPRKGIEYLEIVNTATKTKLLVGYKNGKKVLYEDVHGTWGFPCVVS